MSKLKTQISQFHLVGQLSGFVLKDGYKLKYLKVKVSELEYWLKFPKELLQQIAPNLTLGSWLEIRGTRKLSEKTGKMKLTAEKVQLLTAAEDLSASLSLHQLPAAKKKAIASRIVVCQKSSCRKRGAENLCQAIEEGLQAYNLADEVRVQGSGCLKRCKKGPNLIVMPGGVNYDRVTPKQIPSLLQRHFAPVKR